MDNEKIGGGGGGEEGYLYGPLLIETSIFERKPISMGSKNHWPEFLVG